MTHSVCTLQNDTLLLSASIDRKTATAQFNLSPFKEEANIYTPDKLYDSLKYSIIQYYRVCRFRTNFIATTKNRNFWVNFAQAVL